MDGFWITDLKGRFLDVNDSYCSLTGYSREDILKMGVQDVEAVEKPEDTARRIRRLIDTGHDRFETRHRCRDGRIVDIEVSTNIAGRDRICVFLRDITQRRQKDEDLRKYREDLEALVEERAGALKRVNKQLSEEITERVRVEAELKKKLRDLEIFHRATIDREKVILELKKRVKELEKPS